MPGKPVIEIPQVYSMPAAAPMYVPPPYHYPEFRMATIFFRTAPEVLGKLVPAPLQPNPERLMGVYYSQLTVQVLRSESSYKEVGIIVPVTHGQTAGVFFVALYLDTTAGVVTGREIWGFPKKDAEITFSEEGGAVSTVVSRFGFPLIKATMRLENRVKVIRETPPQALFNLKVIPSVKRGAPPDVLQLTSLPSIQHARELYEGPGTLEFGGSPFDPLDQIPILGIAGGRFEVGDMTLDYGDVVVDYLAPH